MVSYLLDLYAEEKSGNFVTGDNLLSVVTVLAAVYLCYRKKHPIMVIGISALIGVLFSLVS